MSANWKQRPEGGGYFAIWLIRTIARRGGRVVSRLLLYPITLYFLVMRGPERRASLAYLARVLPHPPGLRHVARHIHTFASTILDRVFLLSGQLQRFDIHVTGVEPLHELLDRGQGVLVFGSHLGSFDALRVLATRRPDIKVRVLLDKKHNAAVQHMLDALNPELANAIIDAGQDGPSIVLAIKEALDEGALVALLVDRAGPGEPSMVAPLLGGEARFPTAPWLIAATLRVPVTLAFGLYRGGNRYDLVFESFSAGLSIPRHNRAVVLAQQVQDYARRLQHHAQQAPYNWFNFYDFWQTDDATPAPHAPGDAPAGRRLPAGRTA
ncbi:LpxL/LpxP family acyltransferase [Agrilutibacter solisilvae]|uniref:Acyltransferase n=1 Tax=Agrilutibacter solisilvae TaxID=2763317 RepID=A0A975ATS1_9GAMM|nr:acyltransferase [Lysobacter solisilvae]